MLVAALLSVVVYVLAVRSQGGLPAWWLFVLMVAVACGAAISSIMKDRLRRRSVLLPTTTLAAGLGLLTYTSIGGPLLLTAALGVLAFVTDLKQG
jgi:hypothetical protein